MAQKLVTFEELLTAYYDCRKKKRKTINAAKFELNLYDNLYKLLYELNNKKYKINNSITFIVNEPVKREIFAGDFRDRIVQHLVINRINKLLDKHLFIDDSYSCRVGKGTLYGAKRLEEKIKECSNNYEKETYILKCDLQSFFMSINKDILYKILECLLNIKGPFLFNNDVKQKDFTLYLLDLIIYNDARKNCIIKGKKEDWIGLPKGKSLFYCDEKHGLPIGNLTSQILANLYLHYLDMFIINKLGFKFYGRYVDDFYIIDNDKEKLKNALPKIKDFLKKLEINLHPKKIYLQEVKKGVKFIGVVVKPNRLYISNRTKGNFWKKMKELYEYDGVIDCDFLIKTNASINSYLGMMKHMKTYKIRKRMLSSNFFKKYYKYFIVDGKYRKISLKKKYKKR